MTSVFWAVLEHVEGTSLFEGSGPVGGIGEELALRYFRDVVRGLVYLHSCVSV
jgi:[calcium/calmodulin-dependent protein kinase] kinase